MIHQEQQSSFSKGIAALNVHYMIISYS